MKLVEIASGFNIDSGSPCPTILSDDNNLFLVFYVDIEKGNSGLHERNTVYDTMVVTLKFSGYLRYIFGIPGDEAIQGHPYNRLGMESYSFYELKDSDFIESTKAMEKTHPYYDPSKWMHYKHYILTFHDNMFECIAKDYEIIKSNTSIYSQVSSILNEISVNHF